MLARYLLSSCVRPSVVSPLVRNNATSRYYIKTTGRIELVGTEASFHLQGGSKSKLLVLNKYVNKTEKIGGM